MRGLDAAINIVKITDTDLVKKAFEVIKEVYIQEKKWMNSTEDVISMNNFENPEISWFLAFVHDEPAGVLRLKYDISLDFPEYYDLTVVKGINLKKMAKKGKYVDIGRFMIRSGYRKNINVSLSLMKAAFEEVVTRGYTHFITDVFEGEINSSLEFHKRNLGFEVIGTHLNGELNSNLKKVILVMDIYKSYKTLKEKNNRIYHTMITRNVQHILDEKK